ncbi:MAG: hypothetical protein EBR88_08430, partial [Betaproteobacteria bacterium]|nr:hypothetical protein [Betaproteobacteria bacterium]
MRLDEPSVLLRCREADLTLVRSAIPRAAADFSVKTGKAQPTVDLDSRRFLPAAPQWYE